MKTLYYRPKKVSKAMLLSLGGLSLIALLAVEGFPAKRTDGLNDVKFDAAKRAEVAMSAITERRIELKRPWAKQLDPAKTMLIGPTMSPVTTQVGHLDAKRTSINPNFAAVVVELLHQAGVKRGDRVAIGCTGSFPGLDIAAYTAADAMGLKSTVISSATSSQYGANDPEMMWPDMERLLFDKGLISTRSIAISLGGVGDRGVGMTPDVIELLTEVIDRNDVPALREKSLRKSVDARMERFTEAAGGEKYAAYINVGGGAASVRGTKGNSILGNGIVTAEDADLTGVKDCTALRFLKQGVPVVNLINAESLAKDFGLAIAPIMKIPAGEGAVFGRVVYRRSVAIVGIALILLAAWWIMHPTALIERLFHGKDAESVGQMMV